MGLDHEKLRFTRHRRVAEHHLLKLGFELRDAEIGAKQRSSGKLSQGRRGQNKVKPETLHAAVLAMHRQWPKFTWNDICTRVAKKHKYKRAESVRKHVRDIKWPDPRKPR